MRIQNYNLKSETMLFFAVFVVSCFLFLVSFQVAFAQGIVPCDICNICDFGRLLINLINFLIWNIAVPLAGLMVVVGGLMIMIFSASEEKVKLGRKILTNAIIGIIIVFVSWLLVDTIIQVMTGGWSGFANFGPWYSVPSGACLF